jgi:hypothetical protein
VVPQASGYDSRIKNKNSDLSFIMSYDFTFSEIKNNFSFSWMKTARTDGFDRTMFNIDTDLLMFSLFSKYQIPLRTTVGFATTRNNSGEGESKFIYNMLDLKGEYLFLDEKLDCFVGIKNISAKNEYLNGADLEFDRFCVQAGTTVQIKEMHSIMFNGYIIHYSDNMDRSFNDQIFQLRYDFRF